MLTRASERLILRSGDTRPPWAEPYLLRALATPGPHNGD